MTKHWPSVSSSGSLVLVIRPSFDRVQFFNAPTFLDNVFKLLPPRERAAAAMTVFLCATYRNAIATSRHGQSLPSIFAEHRFTEHRDRITRFGEMLAGIVGADQRV